jgi:hypothetical protein
MKKSAHLLLGLLVPVFMWAGFVASPALAQDRTKDAKAAPAAKAEKGKATIKVLLENDKVRVTETHYKPGDVNVEAPTSFYRVNRTLQGGTLERTYADGRKEKLELKTGTVRYVEPGKVAGDKYTVKNIGNTEVVSYVVMLLK